MRRVVGLDLMAELCKKLKRVAVMAVRRDREPEVGRLCESVERHLSPSASQPAHGVLGKLRNSTTAVSCPVVEAADGGLLRDESAVRARWASYFKDL